MSNLLSGEPGSVVWDKGERDSVKGLHVRTSITREGEIRRVFYLFYRTQSGVQRRPKIGEAGREIDLARARKIAKEWWGQILVGQDPSGERKQARQERTLNEVFDACLKEHWSQPKHQASTWGRQVVRIYMRNIKPKLGGRRLSSLSASDLRDWHRAMGATPYTANRSLRVLSKLFSFSEEKEWIAQHSNPCRLIKAHKEEKRSRFATPEEIAKIGEILKRESKSRPRETAFIYLLLFTGSRPSAIERLTWEDLTVCEGYGIVKFQGKTGKETAVIPFQAMKLLLELPRTEGGTILGIKQPVAFWSKIKKEIGVNDLWARDLRRTFATVGMSSGHNMGVISELLNHKTAQTTMVYAKLMDQVKVETALSIANKMESLLRPSDIYD